MRELFTHHGQYDDFISIRPGFQRDDRVGCLLNENRKFVG